MQYKHTPSRNILHSKLVFFILIIIFLYLGYGIIPNAISFYRYQEEAEIIKESIESKEEEKKSLDETLILLGSDEAIENIARTKLGWSKIGETIIVFSDENASHSSSSAKEELSNIQKWYSYFFKINK